MSPRAAWRLEALGFRDVYDYVASKEDWFANGLPREGTSVGVPWAGDLLREVPTCGEQERVSDVQERVTGQGFDLCVVVNEQGVVAGVLRSDALGRDADVRAHQVMEFGPETYRPSKPVEELLAASSSHGVKSWLVTTSHGVLLGLLARGEAERALEEARATRTEA